MSKKFLQPCIFVLSPTLILIPPQISQAQFTYSAFTEASVAYIGLSGLGMNFASANPAILSTLPDNQRFALTLEANHNNIETTFKDNLPDFAFQLAITSRLVIALAQSERARPTEADARRASGNDPFRSHPLIFLNFSYQYDWSAGLGLQLKPDLNLGIAMRHENYAVIPANFIPLPFRQSFRTFDFGIRRSTQRLNAGLVLRNFIKNRTTELYLEPLKFVNAIDPDDFFVWNPTQFNGIAFEPKFALEGGVHWTAGSHWQLLGDVSSRKEYALGLRWRMFSKLFITTGTGRRFDRVYSDAAVPYTSLGAQFQKDKFALGLTWIIANRSGRNIVVTMPYGIYDLQQITNNRLLIAGALSL
jgi:hypothetical protein